MAFPTLKELSRNGQVSDSGSLKAPIRWRPCGAQHLSGKRVAHAKRFYFERRTTFGLPVLAGWLLYPSRSCSRDMGGLPRRHGSCSRDSYTHLRRVPGLPFGLGDCCRHRVPGNPWAGWLPFSSVCCFGAVWACIGRAWKVFPRPHFPRQGRRSLAPAVDLMASGLNEAGAVAPKRL